MKLTKAEQAKLGIEGPAKRSAKATVQKVDPSIFASNCLAWGLPEPVSEFVFHPDRKWRIDWAFVGEWNSSKSTWLALEINGGIFSGGGHVRGKHLLSEYEKLNELNLAGWTVLIVVPDQIKDGSVFPLLRRAIFDD